jgi:hypothetical protein
MKQLWKISLIFLSLISCTLVSVLAEVKPGSIKPTVMSIRGKVVESGVIQSNKKVNLLKSNSVNIFEFYKSGVTNNEGVYEFVNLPDSSYKIQFTIEPYSRITNYTNSIGNTLGNGGIIDDSGLSNEFQIFWLERIQGYQSNFNLDYIYELVASPEYIFESSVPYGSEVEPGQKIKFTTTLKNNGRMSYSPEIDITFVNFKLIATNATTDGNLNIGVTTTKNLPGQYNYTTIRDLAGILPNTSITYFNTFEVNSDVKEGDILQVKFNVKNFTGNNYSYVTKDYLFKLKPKPLPSPTPVPKPDCKFRFSDYHLNMIKYMKKFGMNFENSLNFCAKN